MNQAICLSDASKNEAVKKNIASGKSAKKPMEAYKCIGFEVSGKTPIAISERQSNMKSKVPTRPAIFPLKEMKNPDEKTRATTPVIISPELNKVDTG